jgi:hypothetical protein
MHKSGHLNFIAHLLSHAQVIENAIQRIASRVRQRTCLPSGQGERGCEYDSARLCCSLLFVGVNFIATSPYVLLSRPESETNWMEEVTEVGTRACQIPYGHAELYRQRQRLRYRAACPGSTSTRGETL